jgi:N-acetylglutamate synthase-like GNAT family acetyltransferase
MPKMQPSREPDGEDESALKGIGTMTIRLATRGDSETCEGILRSLPDWFGIEEAIVRYRSDIEQMETYVAESNQGIVGFLTLNQHNVHTAEIQVMAVSETVHGQGIGRSLVGHAESLLRSRSTEYLEVKTLGPKRVNEHYERTRRFYLALGFRPVEENNLWGEVNPCLILIKHLSCSEGDLAAG